MSKSTTTKKNNIKTAKISVLHQTNLKIQTFTEPAWGGQQNKPRKKQQKKESQNEQGNT
jgi:BRCT domain type II-containing protein